MAEVAKAQQARPQPRAVRAPAYALLSEVDYAELSDPDELEMLGEVAWWTGRVDESIDARTRAFAVRVERGEEPRAALLALKIARELEHKRSPLAEAWWARAERLLAGREDSVEAGYLVRMRARLALIRDLDGAFEHAEQTLAIGTCHGERNLMALGLHDKGTVLVHRGQVDEGMALLDEARSRPSAESWSLTRPRWSTAGSSPPPATSVTSLGRATHRGRDALVRPPVDQRLPRRLSREPRGGDAAAGQLAGGGRGDPPRGRGAPRLPPRRRRASVHQLGELQLRMGDLDAADPAFRDAHALGTDPHPGSRSSGSPAEKSRRRAAGSAARSTICR